MEDQKFAPWVRRREGVCEAYANMFHLTWSKDDVRIRFAQLVDHPDAAAPGSGGEYKSQAEERAAITLTWRMAKILQMQLSEVVKAYERRNGGEININVQLAESPD